MAYASSLCGWRMALGSARFRRVLTTSFTHRGHDILYTSCLEQALKMIFPCKAEDSFGPVLTPCASELWSVAEKRTSERCQNRRRDGRLPLCGHSLGLFSGVLGGCLGKPLPINSVSISCPLPCCHRSTFVHSVASSASARRPVINGSPVIGPVAQMVSMNFYEGRNTALRSTAPCGPRR